jgi:hypothetical protein
MREDIEERINDLMIKSTTDKDAAQKQGLQDFYVIKHKGRKYQGPKYMAGKTGSYFGWSKHIEKELQKLTDDWIFGDAAGLKLPELVKRYQDGEESFFDDIKIHLETKINHVIKREFGEAKRAFTTLEGKSAKSPKRGKTVVLSPGADEYNGDEEQVIELTLEERPTESELRALVDKSLSDALKTYRPGKKTFKSWFGLTFTDDVKNYKSLCKDYWQQKPKKVNWEAFEQKHKEAGRIWDFSTLYENYPGQYIDRLNDEQKRLLNVRATAGAEVLFGTDEARAMGVEVGKINKIQSELEREYIAWMETRNIRVKYVLDTAPRIKRNNPPNELRRVSEWFNKTVKLNDS